MNLREKIKAAVKTGKMDEAEELIKNERRTIRYIVGLIYDVDKNIRQNAAKSLAIAANYHPALIKKTIRRLIWSMNEESCTNAISAPNVLLEISKEKPELLIPMIGDIARLAADKDLNKDLAATLKEIVKNFPGSVSRHMSENLNRALKKGIDFDKHKERADRAKRIQK